MYLSGKHANAFFTFTSFQLVLTKSDNAPNVRLSEYGSVKLTDEPGFGKTVKENGFLADSQFLTEMNFTDKFVQKKGMHYKMLENTSTVVFTCEAESPVFWEVRQVAKNILKILLKF